MQQMKVPGNWKIRGEEGQRTQQQYYTTLYTTSKMTMKSEDDVIIQISFMLSFQFLML